MFFYSSATPFQDENLVIHVLHDIRAKIGPVKGSLGDKLKLDFFRVLVTATKDLEKSGMMRKWTEGYW